MATIALAIGLVLSVEGLVLALAPGRIEDLMRMIAEFPVETRRLVGLGVLAIGVVLVWFSKSAL